MTTRVEVLEVFAAGCDVITFDHELVAADVVTVLERRGHTVRPGAEVLRFTNKAPTGLTVRSP